MDCIVPGNIDSEVELGGVAFQVVDAIFEGAETGGGAE